MKKVTTACFVRAQLVVYIAAVHVGRTWEGANVWVCGIPLPTGTRMQLDSAEIL